jgi:hypothetical protein
VVLRELQSEGRLDGLTPVVRSDRFESFPGSIMGQGGLYEAAASLAGADHP